MVQDLRGSTLQSCPAHAGREWVLPEIVAGEGGLWEARARAVRDDDVLGEGGPAHVGVAGTWT